jgi:hypothetical protein
MFFQVKTINGGEALQSVCGMFEHMDLVCCHDLKVRKLLKFVLAQCLSISVSDRNVTPCIPR